MYSLLCLFLVFFIYSVIGYIAEIMFCTIKSGKLVWNRGFLIGPYLPIYGTGGILISYTLGRYADDPLTLFILSMVYCTVIEYVTSYVLERIFHLRWWDYSNKKFNINGRVCLSNGVLFGLGGLWVVKILYPIVSKLVYNTQPIFIMILSSILLGLFLTDFIVSTRILIGLKVNMMKITKKDATSEIKKEVSEFLKNYNVLTGRLFKSFPDLEKLNGPRIEKITKVLDNIKKELGKIKPKTRNK